MGSRHTSSDAGVECGIGKCKTGWRNKHFHPLGSAARRSFPNDEFYPSGCLIFHPTVMAWIESHQALGRHPKVARLAARVRACRPQVIGHLHYLWWWALDFAPSGDLSAFSSEEIAAGSEWNGDADLWLAALKECRWIDDDSCLHDWDEYAGRLIKERERDKERKRVQRMSAGCPPDGGRTAGVPNPTQPNPNNGAAHRTGNSYILGKELDRIQKEMDDINNSYDSHQSKTESDRNKLKALKSQRSEIRKSLGL